VGRNAFIIPNKIRKIKTAIMLKASLDIYWLNILNYKYIIIIDILLYKILKKRENLARTPKGAKIKAISGSFCLKIPRD
jgi:hypothetical protein